MMRNDRIADIFRDHGQYVTGKERALVRAIAEAVAPHRTWVGLTHEDFLEACQLAENGNYLVAFQRIQAKLKEKNA